MIAIIMHGKASFCVMSTSFLAGLLYYEWIVINSILRMKNNKLLIKII